MAHKISLALFIMFFSSDVVLSCTIGGSVLRKFDRSEYIFIGTVERYVDNVQPKKLTGEYKNQELISEAAGLVIKPKDYVFTPNTQAVIYEVFDFDLYANCSQGGMKLLDVKRKFPIGSEIRIIARDSFFLPQLKDKNVVRLEITPIGLSSISLNIDQNGKSVTSGSSVFDYKTYNPISDSLANYSLPDFELRKDLLRLERAKGQEERNEILDRIVSAPASARFSFDLAEIFRQFTSSALEYQTYLDAVLKKLMTEDEFQRYKAEQTKVVKSLNSRQ